MVPMSQNDQSKFNFETERLLGEMGTSLLLPIIDLSSPEKISTAQLIRQVVLHLSVTFFVF